MSKLTEQYSQLSISVTQSLTKDEKKDGGIFITPRVIIEKLFESIQKYTSQNNITIQKILEPACGTCEIVSYCDNHFNNVTIDAVEISPKIFNATKELQFKQTVNKMNQDYMTFCPGTNYYDLIVTNPPYFVLDKSYPIPKNMKPFVFGRPNIFGLFILQAISMIAPNGIIAFIIPKSFLNSSYYSKIRNYIKQTCRIVEIIDFEKDNKFIDTQQSTFGMILKREPTCKINLIDCEYSIKIGEDFIFTNNSLSLKQIFEGSTTLSKLGLNVRTGSIVWNEHKIELTNDPDETLLLYNSNLTKEHTIDIKSFKNEEKLQYIKRDGRIDPVLLVNRGNGNSKYKLNYALVTSVGPYLIENHLNEIYSLEKREKKDLLILFNKVMNSFENPKTQLFIDLFLGNNGLSKTELETIFPIYL
jgi:adenine-specific DNA-methyltransferase